MQLDVMFKNTGRKHDMTLNFDATNTKLQRSRNMMKYNITNQVHFIHTVVHHLTAGGCSEKCVVRQLHLYANVIQCTYTNLDSTV